MNDALEFTVVLLFTVAPLTAILAGYAVFSAHRRSGSSRPVRRGVGVAVGLLIAAPAAFVLVGRSLVDGSLAGGPVGGALSVGALSLLGAGIYLLAGGRRPALFG